VVEQFLLLGIQLLVFVLHESAEQFAHQLGIFVLVLICVERCADFGLSSFRNNVVA
jgi:hypothetical protein